MRYEVNETEVLDTQTGLIWQKYFTENLTHEEALDHAERVARKTGLPWRVPTIDELVGLIDWTHTSPASAFPDMPETWFWSSSLYVGSTNSAWYVNFYYGYVSLNLRYGSYAVRLVRGG
jgi:hypothetical protein